MILWLALTMFLVLIEGILLAELIERLIILDLRKGV